MSELLLNSLARKNGTGNDGLESVGGASTQVSDTSRDEEDMQRLSAEVERVKGDLGTIMRLLMKLERVMGESIGVQRAPPTKARRNRIDADIAMVSKLAKGVEWKLDDLDRANEESWTVEGAKEDTRTDRIRLTTTNDHRMKLNELMDKFEAFRGKLMNEDKEAIERRSDDRRKRGRGDEAELATVSGVGADNKCPPHPGFMWDVCFRCGERKSTVPNNDPVQDRVGLRYIHEDLEVSELEATRVRNAELRRVTGKQKLLLVVDLDHTMLNSARFSDVPIEERDYLSTTYLRPNSVNNGASTVGQQKGNVSSLYQLTNLGMWTKLRPFAHRFLEEASKLYEMYVYTMGERIYALAMASLLDPTGQLFGDRIISQTDSTKRHTKDLDVVLGAESAVVILDDTEGVWPNHRSNLILMERYHFFTSSCNQFRLRTPSLAQMHRDESETEGTLANTLRTLQSIHHEYFNGKMGKSIKRRPLLESPDVREIIRTIRGKLLAGCNIVFSRIFPTGLQNPEFHPFWKLAVELGARCRKSCDQTTTHVVALDRGTDKARWAKQHGVFLVHPRWVEAASYMWSRPHEGDYPVNDDASAQITTTFSRIILVERVIEVIDNNAEDELFIDAESKGAEVSPSIDVEKIASTTGELPLESGLNSPDSVVEAAELP